jgi:hypothetical protein
MQSKCQTKYFYEHRLELKKSIFQILILKLRLRSHLLGKFSKNNYNDWSLGSAFTFFWKIMYRNFDDFMLSYEILINFDPYKC